MEQISEPDDLIGTPSRSGPPSKRLPGFTFLAWLGVIVSAGVFQGLRTAADHARSAGLSWIGGALDALAVVLGVGLAVSLWVALARRNW